MSATQAILAQEKQKPVEETPLQKLRIQVKHKDGDTRGIAKAFMEVWDKDGSGELTRAEFLSGLKSYGVLVGDMTEAEKKALWAEFDATGDGTVDLHEFLLVLGEVYGGRMQLINEGFNKLDSDGSGEITIFELKGNSDIVNYFESQGNGDGLISRQEFATFCSSISSACPTDEEFRLKMEELTDVKTQPLPAYKYFKTDNPEAIVEWINKLFANPAMIMGGCQKGTFHVWARPNKRSYIKGSYTYEFELDEGFGEEMSYADFNEGAKGPVAKGFQHLSNKSLLTEAGAGALIDVDAAGNAYFLKVKTKPKRGAKPYSGKLRYLASSSMQEVEAFINKLEPLATNITAAIQWPQMHIFVNDVGQAGFQYKFKKQNEIPFDLIEKDQCLILGFNDDGECLFLEIPPVESKLGGTANVVEEDPDPVKLKVRNPETMTLKLEGIYDTEEKLRELFDRIDIDNSGYITQAEMKNLYACLEKFGVDSDGRAFVRDIMDRSNMMADEKLSFDEFCVLMLKVAQW